MTGRQGRFHSEKMIEYGTNVVAGVTPGRKGEEVHGVPILNNVQEAVEEFGAEISVIFVPAPFAKGAMEEAIQAGVKVVIPITEGIPVLDMVAICELGDEYSTIIIGPNTPGVLVPDQAKLGIMPGDLCHQGSLGVITKSGTLSYEIVKSLDNAGVGVSSYIGVGGDPVRGLGFVETIKLFQDDKDTKGILLIGEIGGDEEERAAKYIKESFDLPVFAYIAGKAAPEGKRMGHAGAIISGKSGTVKSKIKALTGANVSIAETPWDLADMIRNSGLE